MGEPITRRLFFRGFRARPRRHRIVRACVAAVGIVLIAISICSLIPAFTDDDLFLGVFRTGAALVIFRFVAGVALLASSFAGSFAWGRAIAIVLGLAFGVLGLAGGLTTGVVLGLFRVSAVDSSFHALLCTVLLGVGALSLDRFAEIAA
jgi:hypothetical protein